MSAFQNAMTQPVAPVTTELLHFREKDRVQDRAYPGGGTGREYYPPKSYCRPT